MRICVVGLGTIGSFFSTMISEFDNLTELTIIDFDKVEEKNIINTAYRHRHINMKKVDAIADILNENSFQFTLSKHNKSFNENDFDTSLFDYIIDCRDFTYDRENINVRLYFSGRQLIVDCRKSAKYDQPMEGHYLTRLSKLDVIGSVNAVLSLFRNELIDKFIENQIVWRYELDSSNLEASNYIHKRSTLPDVLYDRNTKVNEDKLINLHDNIQPILDMNNKSNLKLYVGSRDFPMTVKEIPSKSLISFSDVIECLSKAIDLPFAYNYYIVSSGSNFIELIPETGAA